MNGSNIQFSRRSLISLVLAVLMLTLAASPALAWFDAGDVNGQAALPCRVISDGQDGAIVTCMKLRPHYPQPVVAEQPLLHPAVARAEQMSVPEVQIAGAPGQ